MDNYQLGRQVLDVADFEPERFNMYTWGERTTCGTVACLAGHALLLSGYTVDAGGEWAAPDGHGLSEDWVGDEAAYVLGMTPGETGDYGHGHVDLWNDTHFGLARFRAIVERAEKENGGR